MLVTWLKLPVSGRQRVRLFTKAILFRPESFQYALGLPIHWPWLSKTPVELHLYGMLPRGLVKRPWWLFKQGMTWKRLILCWDLLNITAKNRPIRWEKPLILTKYYILLNPFDASLSVLDSLEQDVQCLWKKWFIMNILKPDETSTNSYWLLCRTLWSRHDTIWMLLILGHCLLLQSAFKSSRV